MALEEIKEIRPRGQMLKHVDGAGGSGATPPPSFLGCKRNKSRGEGDALSDLHDSINVTFSKFIWLCFLFSLPCKVLQSFQRARAAVCELDAKTIYFGVLVELSGSQITGASGSGGASRAEVRTCSRCDFLSPFSLEHSPACLSQPDSHGKVHSRPESPPLSCNQDPHSARAPQDQQQGCPETPQT